MMEKIKVILVDDHPLVREGLANLINQQPDLEVCGVAGTEPEALELVRTAQPSVAIVDITLENGSGLELIKSIKELYPAVKMLVLSMHDESLYAERALRAGARGYIMKREAAKKIILGIQAVMAGKLYVSEQIAVLMNEKYVAGGVAAGGSLVEELSDRELEVFQLLGLGHNTRHIAEHLHVGFKTVQSYCARIKDKLRLANANELLREAVRWQESQKSK
jgi:DNA-binding NarL/FixJ family response regulator